MLSTMQVIAANIYASKTRGLEIATIGCKETRKSEIRAKIIPLP